MQPQYYHKQFQIHLQGVLLFLQELQQLLLRIRIKEMELYSQMESEPILQTMTKISKHLTVEKSEVSQAMFPQLNKFFLLNQKHSRQKKDFHKKLRNILTPIK